jgi:nitric oxide reductase large subunit
MLTQREFWILIIVVLLIANLALLFYVKLDFDKKSG